VLADHDGDYTLCNTLHDSERLSASEPTNHWKNRYPVTDPDQLMDLPLMLLRRFSDVVCLLTESLEQAAEELSTWALECPERFEWPAVIILIEEPESCHKGVAGTGAFCASNVGSAWRKSCRVTDQQKATNGGASSTVSSRSRA
jgi:hypothetical protein